MTALFNDKHFIITFHYMVLSLNSAFHALFNDRDLSQCLSASAETTMLFMMANATPSTGDAMVQTEKRSPTGSVLLVAVKLDLSSTIRE